MRFRLTAFGLHLTGSACALALVLGSLYLGWYRWPGWYLAEVARVVGIVAIVDIVLGPTLTLIVANPRKPHGELVRDLAIIVAVQLAALCYGGATLWQGRPLYYTFSLDRLEIVQASEIKASEVARARQKNPALAPHWYNLPRWVWAPLPKDPEAATKIVSSTLFGGDDVIEMPFYFRPWEQGLPELRKQLGAVADMKELSKTEQANLPERLSRLGLSATEHNALIMWGAARRVLVVFDTNTLAVKATLRMD
jgi:hypothetical protein